MKKTLLAAGLSLLAAVASAAPGTTKLTWYGHAAFEVVTPQGHVLLIDPWISNPANPNGKKDVEGLKKVDYILVTHGHFDHVGDAVAIAKATKARLVTNFELGNNMARLLGYPKDQMGFDTLGNIGGQLTLAGGEVVVEFVPAIHSSGLDAAGQGDLSSVPPIAYGGNPSGFLIKIKDGPTLYHTGDTAFFKDMELLAADDVDAALINIGGHFGMEPDAAANAARAVNPRLVIPQHYKTFPILTQDAGPFFKELDKDGIAHLEMRPGQTVEFSGRDLKK
jgi:L-ascorbate metabolism protein UlaG (beta-lactamase superfamily)